MSTHLIPRQNREGLRAQDERPTWRARREQLARRRRLASELASYRSAADLNDLNALLDSYPDAESAELRELLNRQQIAV